VLAGVQVQLALLPGLGAGAVMADSRRALAEFEGRSRAKGPPLR